MKAEAIARYARHVNPAFVRLLGVLGYGRVFASAAGTTVKDVEGREYLDCLAGFGAVNLGHNHPRLVRRLQDELASGFVNLDHLGPGRHAADLAEALAKALGEPFEVALFSSSGAEAVEAGMKLARAATRRPGFVSCAGGFHGTNLGTLAILGADRMRAPFEPLLPGTAAVPFGDLAALEGALRKKDVAAFVVEPIQAEAGVVLPPPGYLAGAADLCRRYGTLLVLDEVQTGLGRTGTLFAFQGEPGLVPDVVCLAKSLSGGLVPVAATVTRADLHRKAYGTTARFDLHSSTFGGNPLSMVAGLETLRILEEERLVENARARGSELLDGLRRRLAGHPLVRDVRGRGLLAGVELGPLKQVFGQWVALRLLERGFLCQPASQHWNVLRLEPPLTIGTADVARIVEAVGAVLDDYRGVAPVLRDVGLRLGRQFLAGWSFP